jgi:hypothetical protein
MMGRGEGGQDQLFYSFDLDNALPPDLPLRSRSRAGLRDRPRCRTCHGSRNECSFRPYGKGVKLVHIVGSDQGGAYEWTNADGSVKRGIVAIDLNSAGQIERLDTTWDNGVMSDADLQALVLQSIEK